MNHFLIAAFVSLFCFNNAVPTDSNLPSAEVGHSWKHAPVFYALIIQAGLLK